MSHGKIVTAFFFKINIRTENKMNENIRGLLVKFFRIFSNKLFIVFQNIHIEDLKLSKKFNHPEFGMLQ